ncbi:MAG: DinB family protein [Chloroflexi bacterium]|nr:DinB family protein [Chloroflexota bacterium]
MITDPDAFLRYFDSIHRRTLRDIAALPPAAESWVPPAGEGEQGWGIYEIVRHIAESRLYFAKAYRGEGWIYNWPAPITEHQASWLPALEASAQEFRQRVQGTPPEWLNRRVQMIDTEGTLSGWRVLMMLLEHEVHHRSQIDTYAGLESWDVPQIFDRYREQVELLQEEQRRLHPETP